MNKKLKHKLLKTIITISILEGIYLFALPLAMNCIANTDFAKNIFETKTNATINYENAKFKTHIIPALTVSVGKLQINDKKTSEEFVSTVSAQAKIALLPLLNKKLEIKSLKSNNISINLEKDENGIFNFEKLFPKKEKKSFKLSLKNFDLNLNELGINLTDQQINKSAIVKSNPIQIKINSKQQEIDAKLVGEFITKTQTSDFEVDFQAKYPLTKELGSNVLNGKIIAYNIDLDLLKPLLEKYIDQKMTQLSGLVDFIQISAETNEENKNQIVVNTTFNNLVYDRQGWENYVDAKGANTINANIELAENIIELNTFHYTADKIDIKANGNVQFEDKPVLDLNIEVNNSRAENIASILPPNLAPQHMIIQKVKRYGVFGNVEGKVKVQGKVPQPNIIGYVKGRNVHVLNKDFHKTHKGTVDITFDKRMLHMDILVDMLENQKATVKGYTYMFRDGLNNVTIKTTDNIDFPLAQKIIIPVSKVFNFQLGPIPEMDITSGKGKIDLNIQGSIDVIKLDGYAIFDKAKLTYNGLYGEARDGKGRLDFKDDVISFKTEKAFVKNNPLAIEGRVRINHDLDFSISSLSAEAKDVIEIIKNSSLLKDVKEGLAIITEASGALRLFVNMKSKIVPVPYGHPPLPPEEAFEDMKVKGSVYMLGNSCKIEGFYTPIEKIKGIVDFTEKVTELHALEGVSGTSPLQISGQIINDIETKIPEIDIVITSKSVNLKDTIKFLTQSYMYPKDYPDLSCLYNIASKHDLYFTYKAKAIDFLTDKAYAVMNFIPDKTDSALKAKSGRVIMENATVNVEDVIASLYDSHVSINGKVHHVDTLNPEYNLIIDTENFNLSNLNDTSKLNILPEQIKKLLNQFKNFNGFADIKLGLNKNILEGKVNLHHFKAEHIKSGVPFVFDDFIVHFANNKIYVNDLTAQLGDVPFFGNIIISDLAKNPNINGFFTSKITNNFIRNYFPFDLANKIETEGDINFSANFNGTQDNFNIIPKLTFNIDSDFIYDGTSLGETGDKREFTGFINIKKDKINIKDFDYIKYIASQNNKNNAIKFATLNGNLSINKDNIVIPEELTLKTHKNISARILNLFLKNQLFRQGSFNCDLKYITDNKTGLGKLLGDIDCRNIDIPLFDTIVKNIDIKGTQEDIDINLVGFMGDSRIKMESILENKLGIKPQIKSLNIYADQIDNNKLFGQLSKTHKAMNTNNNIKNIDLSGLSIKNGNLEIKTMTIKSMIANNFRSAFSIDEKGIFHADNTSVQVGEGIATGNMAYNLATNEMEGNFELSNVDANYIAETLFDAKNQVYGNANGKIILSSQGTQNEDIIKNLNGYVYFDISDGRMPKLGSLEYLLRASNIIKSGITGFTLNSILEILNLVKTGYFSNINGDCKIENGLVKDIEIFSQGENLSLYIHGNYDISQTNAELEILGKLSKKISTFFGSIGNTSLNTFFRLIPGISLLDYGRKDFNENIEKIPSFTGGDYESRTFQAIIDGNINETSSVQSFKWVE